jgi:cysteine synthase A
MKVAEDILDTIGNTPLLKLSKISREAGISAEIYAKLEFYNPSGSLKDRIYREMIQAAINRGELRPGMEILEVSTGNAGIACSFVGTHLGYKVTIVMPEGMSEERKQLIRAFGGELVFTPGAESDVDLSLEKAHSMLNANPGDTGCRTSSQTLTTCRHTSRQQGPRYGSRQRERLTVS